MRLSSHLKRGRARIFIWVCLMLKPTLFQVHPAAYCQKEGGYPVTGLVHTAAALRRLTSLARQKRSASTAPRPQPWHGGRTLTLRPTFSHRLWMWVDKGLREKQ